LTALFPTLEASAIPKLISLDSLFYEFTFDAYNYDGALNESSLQETGNSPGEWYFFALNDIYSYGLVEDYAVLYRMGYRKLWSCLFQGL
jgi:hypothetical protein